MRREDLRSGNVLRADLLAERARLSPERPALVAAETGERLTYAQLDRRAEACACVWRRSLGLARGARLAILADNSVDFVAAFFAAGKAGVVLVPLNTRATVHELVPILEDCEPHAVVYGPEHSAAVGELREAVTVERWLPLTADGDEPCLLRLMEEHREERFGPTVWDPEDLYCLLYTSGITGEPKGVMIPYRQVVGNGYNTAVCWGLRPEDVGSIATPLYHAGGLGALLVPLITAGGTVVLHRRFDPPAVLEAIEREGCTVVLGVPTTYRMLLEDPAFDRTDLSSVRWMMSGGEPLPRTLIRDFAGRGLVLRQSYGLTEVGINCFAMTSAEATERAGSIGRPFLFTEARIVDREGREAPVGEVGNLVLRGPHVCLGYWRRPEATAAAIDAEGWFHTGDLARRDEDGFFYVVGRKKEMIISGGVNVFPAEIEAELAAHPAVRDAAVIGVPDERWGEAAVAFVVLRDGAGAEELRAYLGGRLAGYKVPREIHRIDELPRTTYGKVRKGKLRRLFERRANGG